MKTSSTTDLVKENQVAPAEHVTEKNMPGDVDVAYRPVTMDTQFEVEDQRREQVYCGKSQKTCSIIVFLIICLVLAAVIAIVIILTSPWDREEPFVYEIIPTNVTADLHVVEFPNDATIETDIEDSIDKLYRNSVFTEVYNQTIILEVSRGSEPDISLLMIFSDLGDHLGSPTGDSDEATDVYDFFLDALRDNIIGGFNVSSWEVVQS